MRTNLRQRIPTFGGCALLLCVAWAGIASAQDVPIEASSLVIRAGRDQARLAFRSDDPSFAFPDSDAPQSSPVSGAPLAIEIYFAGAAPLAVDVPTGEGMPGWRVKGGVPGRFTFVGVGASEERPAATRVILAEARQLSFRLDLPRDVLSGSLGAAAVVVRSTGFPRFASCTVFDSVQRDTTRSYRAVEGSGKALGDCSEPELLAAIGFDCAGPSGWPECGGACPTGGTCVAGVLGECSCVYPTEPCGDTAPACLGSCAEGEECAPINDGFPGAFGACACTPVGVEPCAACGEMGACPEGLVCTSVAGPHEPVCGCNPPEQLCGQDGGFGACPPDSECILNPRGGFLCVPDFCSGGVFPECGGTCSGGRQCVPVDFGGPQICVCATPEFSCDGTCGGFSCPKGTFCQALGVGGDLDCSCEALP